MQHTGLLNILPIKVKELEKERHLKKEIKLIPIIETPYALPSSKDIVKMSRVSGVIIWRLKIIR